VKSQGALTCTSCHNPHDAPRGPTAVAHYNSVCLKCHSEDVKKLAAATDHPSTGNGAGCHMPKRRTDDVVHAVMTDHFIRVQPKRDFLGEIPEAREYAAPPYRGEVVPYYPKALPKSPEDALYLAIAQVQDGSNLSAGIPQLTALLDRYRPQQPEFYLQLGDALRANGQPDKALSAYEHARELSPQSPIVLRAYANALMQTTQRAQAVATFRAIVTLLPDDAVSWNLLGAALCSAESNGRSARRSVKGSVPEW
jgi:predicted CXXCH cytochrome family protein